MIDCPRCGKANAADRASCDACGSPLTGDSTVVRAATSGIGRVAREPELTSNDPGAFTAFGSGETLVPPYDENIPTLDAGGEGTERRPPLDPTLLAEQLAAKNKELKRLQFDLFRATERADVAESRAAAAGSGLLSRVFKGVLSIVAVAAAFGAGIWYAKMEAASGVDPAKSEAALKARIAEQQKKIEELQGSLSQPKPAPAPLPPADAAPAPPGPATPSSPSAEGPSPRAVPQDRPSASASVGAGASTPPAEAPAPPKPPAVAASAGGGREGTITWEGDWRDLIAMAQHRPLTVRLDGDQATAEPEMQSATLNGGLPGVPVRVEALDPGITIVEPPAEGSGWKRLVIRLAPSPQADKNALHVRARLKWTRSDG